MQDYDSYYDEISQGYEELHKREQLRKISVCKRFILPQKNQHLLDVGCGTGISTEPWACIKYGIDPCFGLIKIAKNKETGTDYKVAFAENIPYQDNYFDYVISITAIQNFNDIEKSLKEMSRVLKDNGKTIITTLKRSPKRDFIKKQIDKYFVIEEIIEDDIDIFFVAKRCI